MEPIDDCAEETRRDELRGSCKFFALESAAWISGTQMRVTFLSTPPADTKELSRLTFVLIGPGSEVTIPAPYTPQDDTVLLTVPASLMPPQPHSIRIDWKPVGAEPRNGRPTGVDRAYAQVPLRGPAKHCAEGICACDCEPTAPPEAVSLDYRRRDYQGFLRTMRERLAIIAPTWKDDNPSDFGQMLLEIFAFRGDRLSYELDHLANESYLSTAQDRESVRRHARLLDYNMHEGCAARTYLHLTVSQDFPPGGAYRDEVLTTRVSSPPDEAALSERFEVRGPLPAGLWQAHNEIAIYTWRQKSCCLAQGTTTADLVDRDLQLKAGDFLLLEEAKGSLTGSPDDRDPAKRQVVRIHSLERLSDPLAPQNLLRVHWLNEDRLRFDLCLSSTHHANCTEISNVGVARGNIVLAQNIGTEISSESLGPIKADEDTRCVLRNLQPENLGEFVNPSWILLQQGLRSFVPIPGEKQEVDPGLILREPEDDCHCPSGGILSQVAGRPTLGCRNVSSR